MNHVTEKEDSASHVVSYVTKVIQDSGALQWETLKQASGTF